MEKTIPVGVSSYERMRKDNYYVVDKSNIIQDFLTQKAMVTLITRPRRFGKTLNMSMMAEFFDITKDSKALFEDTAIAHTDCVSEMNQYPTIFLSFANCKRNRASIYMNIFSLLQIEMGKYRSLLKKIPEDDNLHARYTKVYQDIMNETDVSRIQLSILIMCELLYKVYGKPVMLFIDEYDTPFIEAHVNGCYEELHSALAGMLSNVLKDNPYLRYAMLTGIQRVAKENIFSGLNNLSVYTVKNKEYAQYFGFTKEETEHLLEYYGLAYSDEVKAMYDGYHIGDVDVYNPWSIVNYARHKELIPYWVNTSANKMIRNSMEHAEPEFYQDYEILIKTGQLETIVDLQTSFYEQSNTSSLWGLFVNAGYLTIRSIDGKLCTLEIPNNEVLEEFQKLTLDYLKKDYDTFTMMMDGLYKKKPQRFIDHYRRFLLSSVSYHDLQNENSYHSLLLGMCACLGANYEVKSNREAGKGRCDIRLQSKSNRYPSYIIELKYVKTEEYEKHPELLKEKCEEAIAQIKQKKYDVELTGNIIYVALAHSGKDVEMKWIE